MTGFSRKTVNNKTASLNIQAKSLNARFLEVKIGTSSELSFLEEDIRKKIKNHFVRGTIDVNIFYKKDGMDLPLKELKVWIKEYKKNAKTLGVLDDLSMSKVMKKAASESRTALTSKETKSILDLVEKALLDLKKRRASEGRDLRAILLKEVKSVKAELLLVKAFVKKHKKVITEEWLGKFKKINVEADPKRLESEIAILLEKGDIAEEIDRLDMHLKEFVKIMSGTSDLIGKKLDFFCQELAREANTISSKSKNAELTRLSVNLKSYVEKLRQQVQNIQ